MIFVPVAAISAAYKQKEQNGFSEYPPVYPTSQPIRYTVEIRKYFTFANYTMITGDYPRPPDFQLPEFLELTKIPGVSCTRVPSRTLGKALHFDFVLDNTEGLSPIDYVKQNLDTFLSSSAWDNTEQEILEMYLDWIDSEYGISLDDFDKRKPSYAVNIFYEIFYFDNKGKLVSLYSNNI